MTIDEAIKHAREVANSGCTECNKQHEQLAEWLEELATYKKAFELLAEDSTNTSLDEDKQELIDYYLERAKED